MMEDDDAVMMVMAVMMFFTIRIAEKFLCYSRCPSDVCLFHHSLLRCFRVSFCSEGAGEEETEVDEDEVTEELRIFASF